MATLFEKIGGKPAMDAAVPLFYKKVLADDRVKHFFKNTNMDHQIQQQICFLSMAFGGPANYKGKNMTDAHRGMNLTNVHFDAIVEHLGATLLELGVSAALVGEVAAVAETTRNDMLGV